MTSSHDANIQNHRNEPDWDPLYLQVAAQLGEESDGRASLQVRVQILLELGRHHTSEVGENAWSDVNLA